MSTNAPTDSFPGGTFDAFLSHSSKDQRAVRRLHRLLEHYRPPRGIAPRRKRIKIYHYEADQRLSTSLRQELVARVQEAPRLILATSPAAVSSELVNTEVESFLARRDSGAGAQIGVVVVAGPMPPVYPSALKAAGFEPIYADLRRADCSTLSWVLWRRRQAKRALLPLIALLLDVELDDLIRRDRRRRRTRLVGALVSSAIAASVGGSLLYGQWLRNGAATLFAAATAEHPRDPRAGGLPDPCGESCKALWALAGDSRLGRYLPAEALKSHDSRLRFLRREEAFRVAVFASGSDQKLWTEIGRQCQQHPDEESLEVCRRLALGMPDGALAEFIRSMAGVSEWSASTLLEQVLVSRLEGLRTIDPSLAEVIDSIVEARLGGVVEQLTAGSPSGAELDDVEALGSLDASVADELLAAVVSEAGNSEYEGWEDVTASRLLRLLGRFGSAGRRDQAIHELLRVVQRTAEGPPAPALLPQVAALVALSEADGSDVRSTLSRDVVSAFLRLKPPGSKREKRRLLQVLPSYVTALALIEEGLSDDQRLAITSRAEAIFGAAEISEGTLRREETSLLEGRATLFESLANFKPTAPMAAGAILRLLGEAREEGVDELAEVVEDLEEPIADLPADASLRVAEAVVGMLEGAELWEQVILARLLARTDSQTHSEALGRLAEEWVKLAGSKASDGDRFLAIHTLGALGRSLPERSADAVGPQIGHWLIPYLDTHESYYAGTWIAGDLGGLPIQMSTAAASSTLRRLLQEERLYDRPDCQLSARFGRAETVAELLDLLQWPTCTKEDRAVVLSRLAQIGGESPPASNIDHLVFGWQYDDGTLPGGHIPYEPWPTFESPLWRYVERARLAEEGGV